MTSPATVAGINATNALRGGLDSATGFCPVVPDIGRPFQEVILIGTGINAGFETIEIIEEPVKKSSASTNGGRFLAGSIVVLPHHGHGWAAAKGCKATIEWHNASRADVVKVVGSYRLPVLRDVVPYVDLTEPMTRLPELVEPLFIPEVYGEISDTSSHRLDEFANEVSAVALSCAKQVFSALPFDLGAPDIAAADDGSLGFEWISLEKHIRKLFIDIGPGAEFRIYARTIDGNHRSDSFAEVPQQLASFIRTFLDELSNERGSA